VIRTRFVFSLRRFLIKAAILRKMYISSDTLSIASGRCTYICIRIIGVVSVDYCYNCVYYCDTYLHRHGGVGGPQLGSVDLPYGG
jgi:hypothetical protein